MAKLYFRYGTVGSAKTLNLLAVSHNYEQQSKKCLLFKPAIDDRFGAEVVKSRAGLQKTAHRLIEEKSNLLEENYKEVRCILVDEAQFLSREHINQLKHIATDENIPVICYGLRTDFRAHLFEGSRALLELSDSIEEVKNTCAFCNKKATFNLKLMDGDPCFRGKQVTLGCEETYLPACSKCYSTRLGIPWKEHFKH